MASVRWRRLFLLLLASAILALTVPGARGSWSPANALCPTVAADGKGRSRWLSFVWRRPEGLPPVLVQSAWGEGGRLVACAWRTDPALLGWYGAFCGAPGRERNDGRRGPGIRRAVWGPELRRALGALEAEKDACVGAATAARSGGERAPPADRQGPDGQSAWGPRRVRRGWTMPGTLWCGAGDSAGDFSELGVFQGPDVCCREHDQCEAQISALGYKYGMRNYRLHTISHCDCDLQFRHCLMNLNDTISNFIGISFFNLLEVPCFVLEESEECVEWHWWGGCKKYGPMPLAHLVEQSHYQPLVPLTERPRLTNPPPRTGRRRVKGRKPHRNRKRPSGRTRAQQQLYLERPETPISVTALIPVQAELDWIQFSPVATTSGLVPVNKGTAWPPTLGTPLEPGLPKTTVGHLLTEHPKIQASQPEVPRLPSEDEQKEETSLGAGGQSSTVVPGSQAPAQNCSCYRRLDQCPYKIGPHEVKYQLHNSDSRTLFHCNCTRQFARFLRKTKGLNDIEGQVLSDYVSTSCFVLQTSPACWDGQDEQSNCIDVGKAILAPARHLTNQLAHKHWGTSLKVKRQERRLLDQPLWLFRKCRQLVRAARRAMPHQA